MRISLSGPAWQLKGYWPYHPIWGKSVETGAELQGVTEWLPATVPGGVHAALYRAGVIENPYYERNSDACEWVENRWWEYRTRFVAKPEWRGRDVAIVFCGLDYKAHLYLNGHKLGEHAGMFEPVRAEIGALLHYGEENRLNVVFENAPEEFTQLGHTSRTSTQKSRFNYKWDFSTRLVNLGFWDDVYLDITGQARFEHVRCWSDYAQGSGEIHLDISTVGYPVHIETNVCYEGRLLCGYSDAMQGRAYRRALTLEDPKLWWPNGMGAQPLYDVRVTLFDRDGASDEYVQRIGIRSLGYRQCDGASADALPYLPIVNGKDVYLRGVNMVPLDHLYGDVSERRYRHMLRMARDMNANLIRVWGGGIQEKEDFYRVCDEYGLLVWQEFNQSSSGIDNMPARDPAFLTLLARNSLASVRARRNHVCLAFWSGGNELACAGPERRPIDDGDMNIDMLKHLVSEHDPQRLFLPSSPSGPNFALMPDTPGRNHDIHGQWLYEGVPLHYEKYNRSDSQLQSEFGANGMSSVQSLCSFLAPKNRAVTTMRENLTWRHHGEWWCCYDRDLALFGDLRDLRTFVALSQLMQAEAIRYIVESNRRRAFSNCGSIIWQLNEPFPNVANTCLVEYNGAPKHAWHAIRAAFAPLHASLRYESLSQPSGLPLRAQIFVHGAGKPRECTLTWEVLNACGGLIASGEVPVCAPCERAARVAELAELIPAQPYDLYFVRLRLLDSGGVIDENVYFFSQLDPDQPLLRGMTAMPEVKLRIVFDAGRYIVRNEDKIAALFVHATPESEVPLEPWRQERACMLGEGALLTDNCFVLFPGEERRVGVQCAPGIHPPRYAWHWINDGGSDAHA